MQTKQFQAIANRLLEKHYGINLADTHLSDESIVAEAIRFGLRPFEVLNEHADDCDLCRIDMDGFYGTPSHKALGRDDEIAAMVEIGGTVGLSDQPTTCPKCGSRTYFDDVGGGMQLNNCHGCKFEFLTEDF